MTDILTSHKLVLDMVSAITLHDALEKQHIEITDFQRVAGITPEIARDIHQYFHKE